MRVRVTQLDGKLPNLALMRLSHWHKSRGDSVHFTRLPTPTLFEADYDVVYASAIFEWTAPVVERLKAAYPDAIVGGTYNPKDLTSVEDVIGGEYPHHDYDIYPDYPYSLGFTQRGCRLSCKFCVVPLWEGRPYEVASIYDIWRPGTPRKLVLLDNDFFFSDDVWPQRVEEIRDGGFQVSLNQGINIRILKPEVAEAVASIEYRDDQFERRRLYCAWDNLGDEKRVLDGIRMLQDAGVPAKHLLVYMLVGFKPGETMDEVLYRFWKLVEVGVKPFPMPYERHKRPDLMRFQRWAVRRFYEFIPWEEFGGYSRRKGVSSRQMRLAPD